MSYSEAVQLLTSELKTASDRISVVTTDASLVKPTDDKVCVFIQPPEIEFEAFADRNYKFTIDLVAGRPTTQAQAVQTLIDVIQALFEYGIPMEDARPVGWNANGIELASYEVTLGVMDI